MLPKTAARVFKRLVGKKSTKADKPPVEPDLRAKEDLMVQHNLRLSFRGDSRISPPEVAKPSLASPTTPRPQSLELLKLPLEILQLCLTYATTPSFLHFIATCHILWDLAATTRAVLLHHLAQVPGIKLGIDDHATSTPELFLTLRRRACQHLFGAHLRADRTDYAFMRSSFDASASCLRAGEPFRIALVATDAVRLYGLTPQGLVYKGETLADPNLCVSQTAIDRSGNVAVLYVQSPAGRMAEDWDRNGQFLMVYHKEVDNRYRPLSYPITGCDGYKAANMAIYDQDMVAVVLSHGDLSRNADSSHADMAVVRHLLKKPAHTRGVCAGKDFLPETDVEEFSEHLQLYPPVRKDEYDRQLCNTIRFKLPLALRPPPLRVTFCESGQKLKCYPAGWPVPSFRLNTNGDTASDRSAVGKVHIGSCEFLVDYPFCGKHETFEDHITGSRRCTVNYLALGLMVSSGALTAEDSFAVCIIRARRTFDHRVCRHLVNVDSSITRSFTTQVVGRLWGYNGAPTTSLPGVVAYSSNATRIAVANWDKILIWALNGQVMMDDDTGSRYYDTVWDNHFQEDHVVLKPILLRAGSVVRQMAFGTSEDELVALTSGGIQRWNLGASGTGRRALHYLDLRD